MEENSVGEYKKNKIVMVSSLLPATHYSQYLCSWLNRIIGEDLVTYSDTNEKNRQIEHCGKIKTVWRKNGFFVFDILREIRKDRPQIIHLQHELNMYGGTLTALAFPFLVLLLRIFSGAKIVVTIHAVVRKNLIDQKFVKLFKKRSTLVNSFTLKSFFIFLNRLIGLAANKMIVHSEYLKSILVDDYGLAGKKIEVIPCGVAVVPKQNSQLEHRQKFFLCFGYMTRRKGIDQVLKGFAEFVEKNPEASFSLVLAGGTIEGQEFARKEIIDYANNLNLQDSFEFKGFVDIDEIDRLFQNAYAIIIPAAISISASGPLAHAIGYGKCVLASKVGNLSEEITDRTDGYLVEKKGWAQAFREIAGDRDLVDRIESGARKKSQEQSWERVSQQHVAIYESLKGK